MAQAIRQDPTDHVLDAHLGMFAAPRGADVLGRTTPTAAWIGERRRLGTWPYVRCLQGRPDVEAHLESQGRCFAGINFGSQDYLGLAAHPAVAEAIVAALGEFGPHAASSPMLQGNTPLSRRLEDELRDVWQAEEVVLFPTGWSAGFGAITSLVRPGDHVLVDELAHACLIQGARAATPRHHAFAHNDLEDLAGRLAGIRAADASAGVLVVTEGLFSMDSDTPDLRAMQRLCREHGARLLVDVAHDFGASGPGGTGQVGAQAMLGEVDVVLGSFSKTFASNGGFVALSDGAAREHLSIFAGPHIYSNAISPLQCAAALAALEVVRGPEGDLLRRRALELASRLRDRFAAQGLETLGIPSNVVAVLTYEESVTKWTARFLELAGVLANLVEYPAVPQGLARFRFQVMATHTAEHVDLAAERFTDCLRRAEGLTGTSGLLGVA